MNKFKNEKYSFKKVRNNLFKLRNNLLKNKREIFLLLDKNSIQSDIDDFKFCLKYIDWLEMNKAYIYSALRRKPYGRTLVILPLNEPIKTAIIPIISGLFCGVQVEIKCHALVRKLQSLIYTQFIESGFTNISVLPFKNSEKDYKELKRLILEKYYKNIICFSSHKVAEKNSRLCLKKGINFHFECEGNDWLVLNYLPNRREGFKIIKAITSHKGKMCNCLKGVLIKKECYNLFSDKIKKIMNRKKIRFKIFKNPSINSRVVQNPEFKSSLWIKYFSKISQLLKYLDLNKNRLVLHVWSKDEKFIKIIIENTSFARYNLTADLLAVDFDEPWGGIFWSGNKGPIQWYDRFGYTPFIKSK